MENQTPIENNLLLDGAGKTELPLDGASEEKKIISNYFRELGKKSAQKVAEKYGASAHGRKMINARWEKWREQHGKSDIKIVYEE